MQVMIYMRKIFTVLLLSTALLAISCAGSDKKGPGNARIFTGSSRNMTRAAESIDGYVTRELFFTLSKKVNCITVKATAEYTPYQFAKEKKIARTFFILERLVDLSRYGQKNARVFTELGRNFSDRWGRQRSVTVCTSLRLPLQRIDSKSVYRIRFTTFLKGTFDYTITVFSDTPVRFFNTLKEVSASSNKKPETKK